MLGALLLLGGGGFLAYTLAKNAADKKKQQQQQALQQQQQALTQPASGGVSSLAQNLIGTGVGLVGAIGGAYVTSLLVGGGAAGSAAASGSGAAASTGAIVAGASAGSIAAVAIIVVIIILIIITVTIGIAGIVREANAFARSANGAGYYDLACYAYQAEAAFLQKMRATVSSTPANMALTAVVARYFGVVYMQETNRIRRLWWAGGHPMGYGLNLTNHIKWGAGHAIFCPLPGEQIVGEAPINEDQAVAAYITGALPSSVRGDVAQYSTTNGTNHNLPPPPSVGATSMGHLKGQILQNFPFEFQGNLERLAKFTAYCAIICPMVNQDQRMFPSINWLEQYGGVATNITGSAAPKAFPQFLTGAQNASNRRINNDAISLNDVEWKTKMNIGDVMTMAFDTSYSPIYMRIPSIGLDYGKHGDWLAKYQGGVINLTQTNETKKPVIFIPELTAPNGVTKRVAA